MKKSKHFISIFFVALFLLFKVAGLHALTHHEEDSDVQHCEICHITTAVNFIPLLQTEATTVPVLEYCFREQKTKNVAFTVTYSNKYLSSSLFTRPPPQFL